MKSNDIKKLDLFAGAGGFSLGFVNAGFKPGVMIDFWQPAVETLEKNFCSSGGYALEKDLKSYTPKELSNDLKNLNIDDSFDLIIGGPPCQGWSSIGRAKLKSLGVGHHSIFEDPRNNMFKNFFKFVKFYQPKVFVMENVSGMLKFNGVNAAKVIEGYFEKHEYVVTCSLLNAVDFGVPQSRRRLFFVGVRKDLGIEFEMPKSTLKNGKAKFPMVSVNEAIGDLPAIKDGSRNWVMKYKKPVTFSNYVGLMRKKIKGDILSDHVCRGHREEDIEAFRFLKQGRRYSDLPERLKRYRDDIFKDKYRKLQSNSYSNCVTAHLSKDCYSHIHPTQARTISVREAARLQSFPDHYFFASEGMTTKFKLIGNAVPPLLGEVVAREVKRQIFDKL
nr:DNA cytosine methyltransferase [Bacteriovorax sp. HI3]